MKGFRFLLLGAAIVAAGCSGGTRSPDFLAVTTVEALKIFDGATDVSGVTIADALEVDETLQLRAVATESSTVPPGATGTVNACPATNPKPTPVKCSTRDVTGAATWSSSAPTVATVSSSGLVTAVGMGTADITASFGGKTAKTTVNVIAQTLKELIVTPSTQTVSQRGTASYTALGRYSAGGTPRTLNPGTTVTWSLDPLTLATPVVSADTQSVTYTASATETGTGTITAVASTDPASTAEDLSDTATLIVVQVVLTRIVSLDCVPPIIQGNPSPTTSTCTVTAERQDGGTETRPASDFDWTGSSAAIATVGQDGIVTGVEPGTVTVTATLKPDTFPSVPADSRAASDTVTVTGDVCTLPLLMTEGATASELASPLCLGCDIDDPNKAIDGDEETAAIMSQPLGLLAGTLSLTVEKASSVPAGGRAGFLIRQPPGAMLSLELMNQLQLFVLRRNAADGTLTEVPPGSSADNSLRLTLMGNDVVGNTVAAIDVAVPDDPADFDGLRLTFTSGVATALGTVHATAACGTIVLPVVP
jgi:hypothetical protein